jgi:hypothetical protein
MTHRHRLDAKTRLKALEAGLWQRHDGRFVALRKMNDMHLINALLKALAEQEQRAITSALAAEVGRRKLQDVALQVAAERS